MGPVVHCIVSLTTPLRGQFVKFIPTTLSNPPLFLMEKCEYRLQCTRLSHFSTKNDSGFVIYTF